MGPSQGSLLEGLREKNPVWELVNGVRNALRLLLKCIGKDERRVVAVFAVSPQSAHAAVLHVRAGAPKVPVWLYCAIQPLPQTTELCERVEVRPNGLVLLLLAQLQLWRRSVSLSAGTWTAEPGPWQYKIVPLLVPPFRTVFLNENGDFLTGTASNILSHCRWQLRRGIVDSPLRHTVRRKAHHAKEALRNAGFRVKDVAGAHTVLATAHLLRACAYPHRAAFRRLHGNQSLQIPAAFAAGTGIVEFHQEGPAWNGQAFEQLARTSDARWILWRQDGAGELPEHLLAAFEHEHAFAISLQSHYRAWKPALVPMAPFREIQDGAATQVLAPLSDGILVDRQKLLALGIPRGGLAGTAWLILFWKAAAAGWRSYSLGQNGKIGEQPDFPVFETAFFLRMLWEPGLRRLAPREPELSRGNIAFTPTLSRRPRSGGSRPKVLIVSPFLPFPLSHGGAVRIYNICRALSGRVDFALAAIREKHDVVHYDKLHEIFEKVYAVDVDELPSRDLSLPKQVRHHQSSSLRALLASIAAHWNPDAVQVEYTHMAAFRDAIPHVPAILVEHDLTFSLYRQLAANGRDAEAWREYERWHNFERHWLRTFDSVWTVSDEDREIAIGEGSSAGSTLSIPNGVDIDRFLPLTEPTAVPEILYVGSFRHLPNVLGFEKLCREVMPRVWSRHPEALLRIVAGPRHEDFWQGAKNLDRRVTVHGFVEDLRPLYAAASVAVIPLEVSAGTNIKVLEAMACGKAVVTTPAGCAGLGVRHGYDALVHADWSEFADAVSGLLADAGTRRLLAANARRTAESRFSWTAIADCAYDSYESLRQLGKPRPSLSTAMPAPR
jgi:glycosyltransferase involved in cell wall biosynthesis